MITVDRIAFRLGLLLTTLTAPAWPVYAQMTSAGADLVPLVRDVCDYQIQVLQRHDSRLRYRMHRTDHKGDSVRDVIESSDGAISRTLQRNGQPLTTEDNADQEKKLQAMLDSSKLREREKDDQRGRGYGVDLLRVMPTAMHFSLAPEQAPLAEVDAKQIVINFVPDPAFHPSGMAQQILTSVAGRMWITQADHRLLRVDLHNLSDVNLAWGILAKVYPGGSLTFEQRPFQDLYTFTHIVMHMKLRELMVKTEAFDVETTATDFQRLPQSPSGEEAVRTLLALRVPTR